jgi:predicted Fe-Mo cluster-binding NifX family protein
LWNWKAGKKSERRRDEEHNMRVAISAMGQELSSPVDPRFGRCRFLVLYDMDTGKWEAAPNENVTASGGAGTRTAQIVLDREGAAVITGNIGPNAMEVLLAGNVLVYTGVNGTVESALQLFKDGRLTAADGPNASVHSGMRGGMGSGSGMGLGRGRGGQGRGQRPW